MKRSRNIKRKKAPAKRQGMPAGLPPEIRRRLGQLTSRALRVAWAEGGLRLVALAAVLAVVQGAADWLFDLSVRVRALFLLADVAVVVFLVIRHGVIPWRRRLSPDAAALVAERRWPEFRSLLISAVQLAREPNGSPAILAAIQRQAAEHAGRVDLRQAIAWRRLRTLAVTALALLAALAALAWWTMPASGVLARRTLLQNVPLPTRTVVVAISENFTIVPGESVELSARAQGEFPRHGRLEIVYAGKPLESLVITPKPASPDVFSLSLPNVQGPFTYRFYLGDGRGTEWQVGLVRAPAVRSAAFRVVNPLYTGLGEAPVAAGNMRLLAGSRLRVSGSADQPLQSAHLAMQKGDQTNAEELTIDGEGRTGFQGELAIPAKGLTGFSISLLNKDRVASRNDTLYAVEIVPDAPPEIVLGPDQPEKGTLVTADRPRLRFDTRDDFAVEKVFLCVEPADVLGEGESPDPAKAKRVPIEVKKPAGTLTFDFRWTDPEKTVKWQEGNTFYYWIEAVDNNNVTGPGVTRTSVREWSVVSLKTKRDELTESLRRSADSIENLSHSQEELRARVGALIQQGSEPKKP